MSKLFNLARMTTVTTGAGPVTLNAAVPSFLTFAQAGAEDGDMVTYAIEEGISREIGRGVYSTNGAIILTRNVLRSTNGNNPINLNGNAHVAITAAAEDFTNVIVSPTAPVNLALNSLWFDSVHGGLFFWFNDGDSIQWVSVAGQTGQQGPRGPQGIPGPDGFAFPDVPVDGAYLRKNGAWIPLTHASAALTANVGLGATWTDGPSVSVGNEGTWFVSAGVTIRPYGPAHIPFMLWDGTSIIATSWIWSHDDNMAVASHLSGVITNPAGPLRVSSYIPSGSAAGEFVAINLPSNTTKNSSITALRIG